LEDELLGEAGAVCAIATTEAVSREKRQSGAIKKRWMYLNKKKDVVRRTVVPFTGTIYYFAFFGQAGMSSTICLGNRSGISISCLPLYLPLAIFPGRAFPVNRGPAMPE
jgi:hypothetical protein